MGEPEPADGSIRRWILLLVAIVAVGVAVRLTYVLVVLDPVQPGLDAIWYQLQGGSIRNGTGFVVPTSLFRTEQIPTAGFPPVYPTYQAAWQWVFGGGPTSVRLAGVGPAMVTIALTGLLGRRLAGPRVGLLAAAIAAFDPTLLAVDGSAMSENVTVPLVLATVVVGLRVAERGVRPARLVLLGLVCGLAILSRQDLLLLLALVAIPAILAVPDQSWSRRLAASAVVVLIAALVVVPWAWRNERQVNAFTVSTLSPSSALAGSYCDATYSGADLGSWRFPCVIAPIPPGTPSEKQVADAQQSAALRYARRHLSRLPLVVAAREARVWGFWDPRDLARRDADESRRYGWQLVSRPIDAATTVVGVAGLVMLARRRRTDRAVLTVFAPVLLVVFSSAITYGNPRFNSIAHPVLAVGIALAANQVIRRWRPTPARRATKVPRPT